MFKRRVKIWLDHIFVNRFSEKKVHSKQGSKKRSFLFYKKLFLVGKEALLGIMKALPGKKLWAFSPASRLQKGPNERVKIHDQILQPNVLVGTSKPCHIPL